MPAMTRFERSKAIRGLDLPATHKAVLWALLSRANEAGECYPSLTTLAKDAGLGRSTLCRVLMTLCNNGLVKRQKGIKPSTLYTLQLVPLRDSASPALAPEVVQLEVEANAKLPAKPIKRIKPGTCNRCKRRPSLHWTGPCEECLNRADHYRRTVAQITEEA